MTYVLFLALAALFCKAQPAYIPTPLNDVEILPNCVQPIPVGIQQPAYTPVIATTVVDNSVANSLANVLHILAVSELIETSLNNPAIAKSPLLSHVGPVIETALRPALSSAVEVAPSIDVVGPELGPSRIVETNSPLLPEVSLQESPPVEQIVQQEIISPTSPPPFYGGFSEVINNIHPNPFAYSERPNICNVPRVPQFAEALHNSRPHLGHFVNKLHPEGPRFEHEFVMQQSRPHFLGSEAEFSLGSGTPYGHEAIFQSSSLPPFGPEANIQSASLPLYDHERIIPPALLPPYGSEGLLRPTSLSPFAHEALLPRDQIQPFVSEGLYPVPPISSFSPEALPSLAVVSRYGSEILPLVKTSFTAEDFLPLGQEHFGPNVLFPQTRISPVQPPILSGPNTRYGPEIVLSPGLGLPFGAEPLLPGGQNIPFGSEIFIPSPQGLPYGPEHSFLPRNPFGAEVIFPSIPVNSYNNEAFSHANSFGTETLLPPSPFGPFPVPRNTFGNDIEYIAEGLFAPQNEISHGIELLPQGRYQSFGSNFFSQIQVTPPITEMSLAPITENSATSFNSESFLPPIIQTMATPFISNVFSPPLLNDATTFNSELIWPTINPSTTATFGPDIATEQVVEIPESVTYFDHDFLFPPAPVIPTDPEVLYPTAISTPFSPITAELLLPSAIPAQVTCNFGYILATLPCVSVNVEPLTSFVDSY